MSLSLFELINRTPQPVREVAEPCQEVAPEVAPEEDQDEPVLPFGVADFFCLMTIGLFLTVIVLAVLEKVGWVG